MISGRFFIDGAPDRFVRFAPEPQKCKKPYADRGQIRLPGYDPIGNKPHQTCDDFPRTARHRSDLVPLCQPGINAQRYSRNQHADQTANGRQEETADRVSEPAVRYFFNTLFINLLLIHSCRFLERSTAIPFSSGQHRFNRKS